MPPFLRFCQNVLHTGPFFRQVCQPTPQYTWERRLALYVRCIATPNHTSNGYITSWRTEATTPPMETLMFVSSRYVLLTNHSLDLVQSALQWMDAWGLGKCIPKWFLFIHRWIYFFILKKSPFHQRYNFLLKVWPGHYSYNFFLLLRKIGLRF